ncbi:ATPase, partial [Candidatus Wolfebacteria bacterium CG_4_10_14_0_8_um_filter_37_11]
MTNWHTKTSTEIFEILKINERGLNKEEVNLRLKEYGLNKLPEAKVDNPAIIFLRQFQSPLIYILFAASLAIFYLKEFVDSLIILGVLFFNAVVGALQEGKAQNTLLALKNFIETNAEVLRDGKEIIIPDSKLVPGDIILLQEGEKIPADARIIVSNNLKIDQASLTGESIPIYKTSEKIHREDLAIIDQKNMVFKGTYIAAGNGQAVVVATGLDTAIGKINQEITLIDAEIPLKKDIRQLSRMIIIIVAVIGAILFFSGIFSGKSLIEMFKVVVAISVSIIPEGLPIVITLVLATGVWRMAKQNALVKKLQAVEALGQAKIIAVDKTGTITKNELAVQEVFINSKTFEIRGVGYEPKGEIYFENQLISPPDFEDLIFSGKIASFCANARVFYSEENKNYKVIGDPTEAALLVFSQKVGFQKEIIDAQHLLIKEIPFDYKNKYHASIRKVDDNNFLTVVGAPESVIPLCKFTKKLRRPDIASGVGAPTEASGENEELESVLNKMLEQGLRVLAFAYNRRVSEEINSEKIPKLSFGGFFGIKDGLRPEANEAIKRAKDAGIRVIMITGDNKITAMALAREAGIYAEGDGILTDKDLDALSEEELVKKLPEISVFARVTPEHKLKIIEAYKKRKEIIAMTGDGVNDAPSLVAADLGIGMGKIGTEVAKEASDI